MGKLCLHVSLFIFDRIIIKFGGNQDRHKSLVKFDFGPNQTTHFGVTCPWVTKISHFRTWIPLKPVGQSWSNFMCSIIGVGERLHKVLGQIDLAHWTQVSDRCPLGYLFGFVRRGLISVEESCVDLFYCLKDYFKRAILFIGDSIYVLNCTFSEWKNWFKRKLLYFKQQPLTKNKINIGQSISVNLLTNAYVWLSSESSQSTTQDQQNDCTL